ncbi:MAG: 6-phosphofructokinase [Phycisphaeraceae bacterium]|nr:6-phosphofructokinase [Phycisphaeraceae bacterium]MDG1361060.1 diphosphate--fructose-6-phosphate 1-phosphotransferase [Phycisphaerales bacterium]MCP4798113.1 6-phosphofructokinase [Phycisphaeraceae bacterium]MCP4940200.1 6-phosphofructokinase [Phycisphaeraceae bacterium]MDG1978900.1 diphosphate--fructose-6-phosphate 1-phosphotransferase [Phycisphaerales bacterium]
MTTDSHRGLGGLGILAGGGPAPGINAVIAAATIRARLEGLPVFGLMDGFSKLMVGDPDAIRPLEIEDVSRMHYRGGSMLGIARANPTRREEDLERVIASLEARGIDKLVTIGGDDTAYSAYRVSERAKGRIAVAHVPKTIDNDLDLPPEIDTFGYQTARAVGVDIVRNLMTDAKTTRRWYVVIAMGRTAGHLALGIGKAAGATLTIVPEEFRGETVPLSMLVDTLVGAIIKRRLDGRDDGVAVIAEGAALSVDPEDLNQLGVIERDAHGHVRLAELDFGRELKRLVRTELEKLGIDCTLVEKNIGYELRCADPVPADLEYCRDLGYAAAKFLIEGGSGALVSMQGGRFVPVPLEEMLDSRTNRMQVRLVDIESTRYAIARRYMIRIRRDDLEDPVILARLAASSDINTDEFRARFQSIVGYEPPSLNLPIS